LTVALITIPDPCLVVLIGAAGSGKSTFAARHFEPTEVLSSDAYRKLIAGDERDQGATRAAFGRLHRDLTRRLQQGLLSVVDATNVERSARRTLVARSRLADMTAVAIIFDLPTAVILARNAARSTRVVDRAAVQRQLDWLRASLDGPSRDLRQEGFAQVHRFRDPVEVDGVRITRAAAPTFTKR
jgi:protein phosphatase